MNAIWLSVVSAVCHAAWNAIVKHVGHTRGGTLLTLTSAFAVTLGLAGVLAFAAPETLVVTSVGESGVRGASVAGWFDGLVAMLANAPWPWIICAALGETAYVTLLGIAYARGDLSVTYVLSRTVALVVVWPLADWLFGTHPDAWAYLGTAFALGGIALVTRRAAPASTTTTSRSGVRIALVPTVLSGVAVGVYHSGYKGAVLAGYAPVPTFALTLVIAVPLLWLLLWRAARADVHALVSHARPRRWILLSGVLSAASFLLAITALATAASGTVLAIRNASIGVGVLLALWLGERPTPQQWLGLAMFGASVCAFGMGA